MGVIELLVVVVVVVLFFAAAIWVIGYLAGEHPKIIDRGLWALCIFIIFMLIANAIGLFAHDVAIPRLR